MSENKADGTTEEQQTSNSEANDAKNNEEQLKAEIEKSKNDYLYLRAEFDNYKRNVIKERSDQSKYGSERLIVEILGVVDNFERALSTQLTGDQFQNYQKGVEMTAQELKSVLQKFGVQELPTQGQPFDPSIHDALSAEETTEVAEGHVFRVFKKAYKLHDRVVRPAQVVVAKKPTQN